MNNCDLIHKWFDLLWCQHDASVIDQILHKDIKMHGISAGEALGREHFRSIYQHYIEMMPDVQIKVVEVFEMDDSVALYAQITGTHAQTGKTIEVSGCAMARVVDCQIVESWESWNFVSMLVQLGEIPEEKLAAILPAK